MPVHLDTGATGTAGVFAALSQLWRIPGLSATHFPDHTPGIDLIAVRGTQVCRIQVKSTTSEAHRRDYKKRSSIRPFWLIRPAE